MKNYLGQIYFTSISNTNYYVNILIAGAYNYRIPTQRNCKKVYNLVSTPINKSYNLKTNKPITLSDSFGVSFDIAGYYTDEEMVQNMFNFLPDYFITFEESQDVQNNTNQNFNEPNNNC